MIRELMGIRDPRELDAIVIGHMHADHYIDLVSLRYLLPWEGVASAHLPVLLPPGGKARLDALATAISERPELLRRRVQRPRVRPGPPDPRRRPDPRFVAGQHYVPAWGCIVSGPDGARIAISGDTGPERRVRRGGPRRGRRRGRGDPRRLRAPTIPRRGHLTAEEAIEMADRAGAERVVLVHFRAELQERIDRALRGPARERWPAGRVCRSRSARRRANGAGRRRIARSPGRSTLTRRRMA